MAWSVLQSASGSTSASTVSATFSTANVQSGTKIIAVVSVGATTAPAVSSVKDGALNTWTQVAQAAQANARVYIFALDTPAGDVGTKPTLTATSSSTPGLGIEIFEVSGLLAGNTTAMLDGTAATLTGTASSTGSPSYTSTAANEFLLSAYGDFGSGNTVATAGGWTAGASNVNSSTNSNCLAQYKNSTNGAETNGFTSADAGGWAVAEVAFKLAAAAAAGLVPQPARRTPHRVQGLPPQRRFRQLLPVPKQLNPPYPFTEIAQRRETWPRGMPRRGRRAWPVPPQLNPPYPAAELRQQRQPRGFFPRTGNSFMPVPAQQAAAQAPAFAPQPLRHARLALAAIRRRAPAAIPAAQDIPPQQAHRTRAAVPPRRSRPAAFLHGQHAAPPQRPAGRQRWPIGRRGRVTWPPQAQAPAAPPAWVQSHRAPVRAIALLIRRGRIAQTPQAQAPAPPPAWVQQHRSPARALALIRRRFRQLLPWPQATAPAFSVGALTAADRASGALTAAGGSSALTAATAAASTLTAGDQRTGGPG